MDEEVALQKSLLAAILAGKVESAHDCSEGGLFISLLESAMESGLGFEINTLAGMRKDAYLFGEAQSRVVISVKPENKNAVLEIFEKAGVPVKEIGQVTAKDIKIDNQAFSSIDHFANIYNSSIEKVMNA